MSTKKLMVLGCLGVCLVACGDDDVGGSGEGSESSTATETGESTGEETESDSMSGDGDGDPATGDGDGDTSGDGDGDTSGDGDGDTSGDTSGDGDGDTSGDGDGDTSGDGDGDTSGDGDGDGDTSGDGDGDMMGCVGDEDCMAGNCIAGVCEVFASCLEVEDLDNALPSGVYELDPDAEGPAPAYSNYCDLESFGGGWTLVIKAHSDSPEFAYDSEKWSVVDPFQPDAFNFDRIEAKLPSWSSVSFTEVMVGMEAPIGNGPVELQTLVLQDMGGSSLFDQISPGDFVQSSAGREGWLGLVNGSSLQDNCDKEGFNVVGDDQGNGWHQARIGILGNEQDDCSSPDSRLAIGGSGTACGTSDAPNGNYTGCSANDVDIQVFGAVFVR